MGWDRKGGTDRTLFTKVALLHTWHHDCYSLYLLVVYNFLIVLNVVYIASLVYYLVFVTLRISLAKMYTSMDCKQYRICNPE